MRDGGFVSIGWSERVPDLSEVIGQAEAKARIREWLLAGNQQNPGVATRKAGEILKFAQEIAENEKKVVVVAALNAVNSMPSPSRSITSGLPTVSGSSKGL
jgi:hypothetical protein